MLKKDHGDKIPRENVEPIIKQGNLGENCIGSIGKVFQGLGRQPQISQVESAQTRLVTHYIQSYNIIYI